MDLWRIAPMHIAIFFALFSGFEGPISEPAEFAYVHDFALFLQLIYHCRTPREPRLWRKIFFTSKYQVSNFYVKRLKIAALE